MARPSDILLTALAPVIWGSTYIVTTQLLPPGYPVTAAAIRALPAGLVLLVALRKFPKGIWIGRSVVLGALNFTIFQSLLFVAAYRLPGGVAATAGAVQPLIVVFVAAALLGLRVLPLSVVATLGGVIGVALLVLRSDAQLDVWGLAAALGGALSMAFGTVLTRKWSTDIRPLVLTSWQLTAGGLLLVPIALLAEPALPALDRANLSGFAYLGVTTALTYLLWFRGIARIEPEAVSALGFLSPLTAIALGWLALGQSLSLTQIMGAMLVVSSIIMSQREARRRRTN